MMVAVKVSACSAWDEPAPAAVTFPKKPTVPLEDRNNIYTYNVVTSDAQAALFECTMSGWLKPAEQGW